MRVTHNTVTRLNLVYNDNWTGKHPAGAIFKIYGAPMDVGKYDLLYYIYDCFFFLLHFILSLSSNTILNVLISSELYRCELF